jgi:hypothetical protein
MPSNGTLTSDGWERLTGGFAPPALKTERTTAGTGQATNLYAFQENYPYTADWIQVTFCASFAKLHRSGIDQLQDMSLPRDWVN